MGSWGYEPKDNDGCWDAWGDLCDRIGPVIEKLVAARLKSRIARNPDYGTHVRWETAGVVQLLLERGVTLPARLVTQARDLIVDCLNDEKFMATWRDPRRAQRVGTKMHAAFHDLLCPSNYHLLPPRGTRVRHRRRGAKKITKKEQHERYLRRVSSPSARVYAWNGWPGKQKRSWMGLAEKINRKAGKKK